MVYGKIISHNIHNPESVRSGSLILRLETT